MATKKGGGPAWHLVVISESHSDEWSPAETEHKKAMVASWMLHRHRVIFRYQPVLQPRQAVSLRRRLLDVKIHHGTDTPGATQILAHHQPLRILEHGLGPQADQIRVTVSKITFQYAMCYLRLA
jgi:hypothetical protein